jgi:CRP/FNR family transcriptional regulator
MEIREDQELQMLLSKKTAAERIAAFLFNLAERYLALGQEVHDRKATAVNWLTSLLRYKVIHHAKETVGQKEADGVMAIPPPHHHIDSTCLDGI